MNWLIILTLISLIISFIFDKEKTILSLKLALKKIIRIFPAFMFMLIIISIVLFVFSEEQIKILLGNDNLFYSMFIAGACGSIAYMPGFIAFPLCGILLGNGIKYMVLSAFSSTLMMVGIVTFPIEKEYLGLKLGILRNIISLIIALIIAFITGVVFGELF